MRETAFEFVNQTDEDLADYEQKFMAIIEAALTRLQIDDACELSCIVVDDQQIHKINRDYRKIDRPTDVISFAYEDAECFELDGAPRELGDIFISVDRAHEQAQIYGHSFEREFCFLFTHGLLHLLGYDHMQENDAKEMFSLQEEILNDQKITR